MEEQRQYLGIWYESLPTPVAPVIKPSLVMSMQVRWAGQGTRESVVLIRALVL